MADRLAATVNVQIVAGALRSAVRYGIATVVVALLAAAVAPEGDAERFATTAYLAAIFAALALFGARVVRVDPSATPQRLEPPSFPVLLRSALGVTIFFALGAALVSEPGAELALVVACCALIGVAALARAGALAALHARLVHGGWLMATTRYVVLVAVLALALAGLLPSDVAEPLANVAYWAAVIAAGCIAISLLAPAGVAALARDADSVKLFARLARQGAFERTIRYAAATMVAAFVVASLLPQTAAAPFAVVAYAAALFATACVAAECVRAAQ